MLKRKIQTYIEQYLKSNSNKILVIDGARQIGKSFIIREVGSRLFSNFIEGTHSLAWATKSRFSGIPMPPTPQMAD